MKTIRYFLALNSCAIVFYIAIILDYLKYFIYERTKEFSLRDRFGKKLGSKKAIATIFVATIISLGYSIISIFNIGNTQIGSFWEKKDYEECYYVYMTQNPKETKRYKLKADIHHSRHIGEDEHYNILALYFPNGGYITFYETDDEGRLMYGDKLLLNEETCITKQNDEDDTKEEYYITLTNQKAPK